MQNLVNNQTRMLRRSFLAGGLMACCAGGTLRAALPAAMAAHKKCIVLWMSGGPSQLDTVDPKPGTKTGGEFRSLSTNVAGLQLAETLPLVARHMDKLAIVRNLTSPEGDHDRGSYYMHTGFTPVPSFPRPAAGAVVSRHTPQSALPNYVSLGGSGFGPAYMGSEHAPFVIEDALQARTLLTELRRRRQRLSLVSELNSDFDASHSEPIVKQRQAMLRRVETLVRTRFVDALNLDLEPEASRSRYGETNFAQNCLLARRLIEAGVHFVEVQLDGWDTHADNFNAIRNLCGELDRPWATLMEDLSASGLLDETLVIWMGEFGRTPIINGANGRDHFPDITPVVIGGGGLRGGQAIGQTSRDGTQIESQSYRVADLLATLFHQFGIKPDEEFMTSFQSPTQATDGGKLIRELIS